MTIQITIRNDELPETERRVAVFSIDGAMDAEPIVAPAGELGGGEELKVYLTSTRSFEVKEV